MKKFLSFFIAILIIASLSSSASAAMVPPLTFPGNETNPDDYTVPEGCIIYQIPDSSTDGVHTISFNDEGEVDPNGSNTFNVTVGTFPGNEYTQVVSWNSTFPIYAVIVNGEDAFNLYQYDISIRGDIDLVSPIASSELPANVSHVSIVICPDTFPTDQFCLAQSQTNTLLPVLVVNIIFQIISTILLGILVFYMTLLLFGSSFKILASCICKPRKKEKPPKKDPCNKPDKEPCPKPEDPCKKPDKCDNEKDKDCDHKHKDPCKKPDKDPCHKPKDPCKKPDKDPCHKPIDPCKKSGKDFPYEIPKSRESKEDFLDFDKFDDYFS